MDGMELRDLNYFLACVEHRSVTAAARAIHVAQPTLSHALARLEREAGVRLLDRRPRDDLRPTAAGRLLLARARDARAAVDGFAADLAALHGMARGELLVASIQSLNATLLPVPIARFVARYPGVALGVRTHPAEAIAQAVRHGREEIGFVAGAPPESGAFRRHHPQVRCARAPAKNSNVRVARPRAGVGAGGRLYRDGGPQRLRARRLRSARGGHA
jgi:DNA-binding transcriptional LysR family regulator